MDPGRYDLVIDGYNLMHASGHVLTARGPRDFEQQRERFLRWLTKRIPERLRPLTLVVFDAGETDNTYVEHETRYGLRVIYSPQGLEADDLIEELIEIHATPKRLQVVSSDHRLHKAARRRKGTCVDSDECLSMLARLAREEYERRQQREELAKPAGETFEQTSEWLTVFADAQLLIDAETRRPLSEAVTEQQSPQASDSAASQSPARDAASERTLGDEAEDDSPQRGGSIAADELAFWEQRLRDLLP
jgi:predicted RNA-binding protein with PIN domain